MSPTKAMVSTGGSEWSLSGHEDLRLEHVFGVVRHFVLLSEVDFVSVLTKSAKLVSVTDKKLTLSGQ